MEKWYKKLELVIKNKVKTLLKNNNVFLLGKYICYLWFNSEIWYNFIIKEYNYEKRKNKKFWASIYS